MRKSSKSQAIWDKCNSNREGIPDNCNVPNGMAGAIKDAFKALPDDDKIKAFTTPIDESSLARVVC